MHAGEYKVVLTVFLSGAGFITRQGDDEISGHSRHRPCDMALLNIFGSAGRSGRQAGVGHGTPARWPEVSFYYALY